ncbi:MAG: hypothetical protein ABFD89_28840 [Bryobacteraceae bacterium]
MSDIVSRRYRPNPDKCCEACCFGQGEHADWCKFAALDAEDASSRVEDGMLYVQVEPQESRQLRGLVDAA